MTVFLVGAGPGDPELLTVRAARLIAEADVIVHDRLADQAILDLARADVEFIDVGKKPGLPTPQEMINTLLVHLGSHGLNVVRLNGARSTPQPWINVIANDSFGFHVAAEGGASLTPLQPELFWRGECTVLPKAEWILHPQGD